MNAYLRLMRLDKPVGIALLWAPTAWALWLANQGQPPLHLVLYFLCGTVLMRSAGCVINDWVDRAIDRAVQRTRLRPLASGELSLLEAAYLLLGLLLAAGWILLQLPKACWWEASAALLIVILYPFAKRWIRAPQCVLGLAFSLGIPMAYTASGVAWDETLILLMLLNAIWTVLYDTIYALLDKPDDLRIGVFSTAILFGTKLSWIIGLLQLLCHGLWLYLGLTAMHATWFRCCWFLGGLIFYPAYRSDPLRAFHWQAYYGLLMWVALL